MEKPVGKEADTLPRSDVSVAVGLAGLAGLFAWIMICRNWAGLAETFGIPGPRAPLSGPYAALLGVVFSGLPMIAWSVLVDKVHRRASTGLDWDNPRRLADVVHISVTKLAGLWATWLVIGGLYCIARWYWSGQYLFAIEVLAFGAVPLLIGSIPYVLWIDRLMVNPRDHVWHFGAMLIGREAFDPQEVKHHLRGWAVKGFFIAFMISIVPGGFQSIVSAQIDTIWGDPVAMTRWLTEFLFVIDVQIAMVGYLMTFRPLDAHIRTANPYLAGWVAALICYPPFLLMYSGGPLDYQQNTGDWAMWLEGNQALLWIWGGALVALTAIYAWATVAFGLRFSNLTYRGVLTNGPYRFTRHPAYLSKNAYWWLATMPFIATTGSPVDMIRNTALLAMISAVYYWRARTEEAHLLGEDAKYRDYHAWMARRGTITAPLERLMDIARRRGRGAGPQDTAVQAAE
jgi:protein-S-isoprenylcysteine O-methyltransferase Ste14